MKSGSITDLTASWKKLYNSMSHAENNFIICKKYHEIKKEELKLRSETSTGKI